MDIMVGCDFDPRAERRGCATMTVCGYIWVQARKDGVDCTALDQCQLYADMSA